jgi:hypothetical protein
MSRKRSADDAQLEHHSSMTSAAATSAVIRGRVVVASTPTTDHLARLLHVYADAKRNGAASAAHHDSIIRAAALAVENMNPDSITRLPIDMLQYIMRILDGSTLMRLASCNAEFGIYARDKFVHKRIVFHICMSRLGLPQERIDSDMRLAVTGGKYPEANATARLQELMTDNQVESLHINTSSDFIAEWTPFFNFMTRLAAPTNMRVVSCTTDRAKYIPAVMLPLLTAIHLQSPNDYDITIVCALEHLVEFGFIQLDYLKMMPIFESATLQVSLRRLFVAIPNVKKVMTIQLARLPFRNMRNLNYLNVYTIGWNAAWFTECLQPELLLLPTMTELHISTVTNFHDILHHICLLLRACTSITKLTLEHVFQHVSIMHPQAIRDQIMQSVAPRDFVFIFQ